MSAETPFWSLNAAVGSFLVPGRRASHDWPEIPPLSRSRLSALAALRVLPQMKELSSAGQLPVILLVLGSARRRTAQEDPMPSKRTTIYLDDCDRHASRLLQARYGLSTLSDVIRFALRSLAAEQSQHGKVSQKPPGLNSLSLGSPPLPHLPKLEEPIARAPGDDSAPQDELAKTQEELHHTTEELQTLNQTMLEMSADRESRAPALPEHLPAVETQEELHALIVLKQQRLAGLLRASGPLRTEHQRLLRQARTKMAKLRAAKAA
jgi:hypothetical protein